MPGSAPILYTQTGCADSAKVRAWLRERDVPMIERNVTSDLAAAQELAATGIFATPLLVVGQHRVLGFRPEQLTAALANEGDRQ
jgi:glutaredoxin